MLLFYSLTLPLFLSISGMFARIDMSYSELQWKHNFLSNELISI